MKKLFSLFAAFLFVGSMWADDPIVNSVIFEENFGNWGAASDVTTFADLPSITEYDKRGTVCWVSADKSGITFTGENAGGTLSNGANCTSGHVWINKKTTGNFTINNIPLYTTSDVEKVKITWSQGGASKLECKYAFDGGSTWNSAGSSSAAGAAVPATPTIIDVTGHSTISLQFVRTSTNTNIRVDNIKITVTQVATPEGAPDAPTFSLETGTYYGTQSVELDCATEGAEIRYTVDNSTPTSTSTLYSSALSITETTTIKAIAIKDDISSAVASITYNFLDLDLDGLGTKANPFSVADLALINSRLTGKWWVIGYIVGCAANEGELAEEDINSNIALGDANNQTSNLAAVQLQTGAIRDALNIVDNKGNKGKQVKVHGDLQTYFLAPGVKNLDDYVIVGGGTALEIVDSSVKSVKFIQNGQLFIEQNGHIYNMLGGLIK